MDQEDWIMATSTLPETEIQANKTSGTKYVYFFRRRQGRRQRQNER